VGRVAAPREKEHSSDARFGTRLRASVPVGPARLVLVRSEREGIAGEHSRFGARKTGALAASARYGARPTLELLEAPGEMERRPHSS
jgi:hypothetical protein